MKKKDRKGWGKREEGRVRSKEKGVVCKVQGKRAKGLARSLTFGLEGEYKEGHVNKRCSRVCGSSSD